MSNFNNVYKGKTILVTGHTGFKGSWLSIWLTMLGAKVVGRGSVSGGHLRHRRRLERQVRLPGGQVRGGVLAENAGDQHDTDKAGAGRK